MQVPTPISTDQLTQLNQLTASWSQEQLIWSSGYLAGRAGMGAAAGAEQAATTTAMSAPPLTILVGSQTGNGEKLAEKLLAKAQAKQLNVTLKNMGDYKKSELKKEKHVLLIASTHGEGDPPDTALELHEFIFSKRAPDLSGLSYSVLSLGDTSYEHFCKTGRDFDEQFRKLGATAVVPRKDCDLDYEADAEAWMEAALAAMAPALTPADTGVTVTTGVAAAPAAPAWSKSKPFMATLLETVDLNGRGSAKRTLHMELSLEGSGLTYAPGDAIGILPNNQASVVAGVAEQLGVSVESPVQLPDGSKTTFGMALTREFEITILTRPVLQRYQELCQASELAHLLLPEQNKELLNWIDGRDLIDLLKAYPVKGILPQDLIPVLRKLPPRLYSLASSLEAHPEEAHITVGVVTYTAHDRERYGVCSTYLNDLEPDAQIPVYIHENRNFKLPADPQTPVIMVGPGTGVAPFRAFLEEREEADATGPNWLFFGDQHFTTDFLYQTELLKYHKDGLLTRLDVAFSRDQDHKVYVQHRMQEQAAELYRWIAEGAMIYVCGDANRMAPDVHETLIQIISEQGGKSREEAEEYVKTMLKEKRYQRDTY